MLVSAEIVFASSACYLNLKYLRTPLSSPTLSTNKELIAVDDFHRPDRKTGQPRGLQSVRQGTSHKIPAANAA